MKPTYDIFISYRRSSSESASLIATKLRAEGYRVFFDVESMRGGNFNEQLYDVIDHCKDFLLILPPNALDRCNDHDDWVRKEVLRAIDGNKNIIPVMLYGFEWPKPMPDGMGELPNYQALTASSVEYFDLSIRRLTEQYLKSKPKHSILLKKAGIILCSILLLAGLLFGAARLLSIPLCNRVANEMTDHLVRLDLLGGYMNDNYTEWNSFLSKVQNVRDIQQFSDLMTEMSEDIKKSYKLIRETAPTDSLPKQYSFFESVLLASRGLSLADIEVEPAFAASYFTDFTANLDYMNDALTRYDIGDVTKKTIDVNNQLCQHLLAMAYYSYMEIMAKVPYDAQKRYLEVAKQFKNLPNDVPLTLTTDEYIQKQNNESEQCNRIMLDLEAYVNNASAKMDEIDSKMSIVNSYLNAIQEISDIKETNETELALRREKIAAMKQTNEQKKAQLEELHKKNQQAFEELKANCAIQEEDPKGYKWGKIVKFATYMEMITQNRQILKDKGVHDTSPITPDVIYAHLVSMLNTFKEYHPESAVMAESAKAYYKEVSKGKRTISGVIIAAIKDDATHPVLQVGDIILIMKGDTVTNYDGLKAAFNKEGMAKATYLRLSDGELKEYQANDCEPTDILGFIDLK